jgi:acetoin utilization protein AcuC
VDWELDDEEAPDYERQFLVLRDAAREGPIRPEIQQQKKLKMAKK